MTPPSKETWWFTGIIATLTIASTVLAIKVGDSNYPALPPWATTGGFVLLTIAAFFGGWNIDRGE